VPFLAATCSDHWLPQLASTGPSTFPIAALEVARDRRYAKPAIVQRPNLQNLTTFWTCILMYSVYYVYFYGLDM
jgi:hypothetical protein